MAARNPIILDKPEDWPAWIEEVGSAIPDEIWSLVDPDEDTHEEFLEKPTKPQVQELNGNKTNYIELTAAEKSVFDQLFKHYQVALKEYERQMKGLQDAKVLIRARVSDAKNRLLTRKDTLRDWLATLKTATSVSKGFISYQTAQKYQESITKTPTVATIGKWLATWELAMAEAQRYQIPEISSGRWLRDLATAIRPLSEVLRATFIMESTDDTKTNPERYLEVSVKIREIVGTADTKRRVTRGAAFAIEFDGEPPVDEAGQENKNKNSRKRARTTSATKNTTRGKKRKTRMESCKACGLRSHELSRCYYAFPELRYPGFEPIKNLEEKVAQALEDNEKLANEVEVIRKEIKEDQ
jgi:hypothetical protein